MNGSLVGKRMLLLFLLSLETQLNHKVHSKNMFQNKFKWISSMKIPETFVTCRQSKIK